MAAILVAGRPERPLMSEAKDISDKGTLDSETGRLRRWDIGAGTSEVEDQIPERKRNIRNLYNFQVTAELYTTKLKPWRNLSNKSFPPAWLTRIA